MIFSNKVYKISSGSNISLFAKDKNNLLMFIFSGLVSKKHISFDNSVRCVDTGEKFSYNKVILINDQHKCLCFDKNISVTNNE